MSQRTDPDRAALAARLCASIIAACDFSTEAAAERLGVTRQGLGMVRRGERSLTRLMEHAIKAQLRIIDLEQRLAAAEARLAQVHAPRPEDLSA